MSEVLCRQTDLRGANLNAANLQSAILYEANLGGALLLKSNLDGAWLWESNLGEQAQRKLMIVSGRLWVE